MQTTLGSIRFRAKPLSGETVMREALRAPHVVMARGLRNYLEAVHRTGLANTADFRLRQRAGLRLQERLGN